MSAYLKPRPSMLLRIAGTSSLKLPLIRMLPCGVAMRYAARSADPAISDSMTYSLPMTGVAQVWAYTRPLNTIGQSMRKL